MTRLHHALDNRDTALSLSATEFVFLLCSPVTHA